MLLFVFLCCKKRLQGCYDRITNMMNALKYPHYVIVTGAEQDSYDPNTHLMEIICNDNYEGLPEKAIKTYKYIYTHSSFDIYSHICKLDDDIIINKLIEPATLSDYCGNVNNSYDGNRRWHIGRCTSGSKFNDIEYTGAYVPWCLGGNGYVLSRHAIEKVIVDETYNDEIYEDLYIAKLLRVHNILPRQIGNIRSFWYCRDH